MSLKRQRHDEFFKAMMAHRQVATDFFTAHLPQAILEQVDFNTLQQEQTTFIDTALSRHESDLIYSVKLHNQQDAIFYALVEHQSQPDELMAFRLHYYLTQGLRYHVLKNAKKPLPLPVFFPILLFNGKQPYPYDCDLFSLFGDFKALAKQVFTEPFTLVDVGRIPEDDLAKHRWAGLMELSLCHATLRTLRDEWAQIARLLALVELNERDDVFKLVVNYNWTKREAGELSLQEYKAVIHDVLPPPLEEVAMNIAEAFVAEGIAIGKAEGKAEALSHIQQAINMIRQGKSVEEIITLTELDEKTVELLRQNIAH